VRGHFECWRERKNKEKKRKEKKKTFLPSSLPSIALTSLYHSAGGANWHNNNGWLTDSDPCTWFGVSCTSENANVNNIELANNNLAGSIPPNIGNLNQVVFMSLE
jgi:hypothetical protein